VIGPVLLPAGFVVAGALAAGWAGAVTGALVGVLFVAAVAAAAAAWAARIGSGLEPEDAWAVAPRPPLFGRFCDAVYRRSLGDRPEDPEEESEVP
jgi:hypothetical protein